MIVVGSPSMPLRVSIAHIWKINHESSQLMPRQGLPIGSIKIRMLCACRDACLIGISQVDMQPLHRDRQPHRHPPAPTQGGENGYEHRLNRQKPGYIEGPSK